VRFHRASELIGRRWTGAIIFVLLTSRCRFAVLRDAIPDITDRMLSDRLHELAVYGEGAWRFCESNLADGGAGAVFVLGLLAFEAADRAPMEPGRKRWRAHLRPQGI
jgi:hypothetical protein